ncbi:MAG: hypothetical protein QXL51_00285 [Candidatus Aenigmatarchaeota archaeon]
MTINKRKSYSILKDDTVFSVDLEIKPFGNKYRVILRDAISETILISELYKTEKEALERFYEIEKPLILITNYLIEGKKEQASKYTEEFLKLLPKFQPELLKIEDPDIEENSNEEENDLKEAHFVGSFNIEKRGKVFLFEIFEKNNDYFGKWSIWVNSEWKNGKLLKFYSLEKALDYLEMIEKEI